MAFRADRRAAVPYFGNLRPVSRRERGRHLLPEEDASVAGARVVTIVLVFFALLGAASPLREFPALQDVQAKTRGHLVSQDVEANPLTRKLDFWLTKRPSGVTLTRYDVDMTKLLHVIIVSDDFSTFLHVHPMFSKDGHFRIRQRFRKPGLYHVYADGEPQGIGQQVFRFDLPIGTDPHNSVRRLTTTGNSFPSRPVHGRDGSDIVCRRQRNHAHRTHPRTW